MIDWFYITKLDKTILIEIFIAVATWSANSMIQRTNQNNIQILIQFHCITGYKVNFSCIWQTSKHNIQVLFWRGETGCSKQKFYFHSKQKPAVFQNSVKASLKPGVNRNGNKNIASSINLQYTFLGSWLPLTKTHCDLDLDFYGQHCSIEFTLLLQCTNHPTGYDWKIQHLMSTFNCPSN